MYIPIKQCKTISVAKNMYTVIAYGLDGQTWRIPVTETSARRAKIKAWEIWDGRTTVVGWRVER